MASSPTSIHHLLLLLLLSSFLSTLISATRFEGFDSDELILPDDDEDLDVDPTITTTTTTIPAPSISTSSAPRPPPITTSTPNPKAANPNPNLHLWDEDEFEGIPSTTPDHTVPDPSTLSDSDSDSEPEAVTSPPPPRTPASIAATYSIEIACVSFLICFVLNYFIGKRKNEDIALAWATKFATADSIFDKNFSLLGTGDGKGKDSHLLLKEGQDVFKFYASGRRFCQGLLATMELKARHDLVSSIVQLVLPKKDTITFEVVMNEEAMDHVVVAVARKKMAKAMHKEEKDLQRFAGPVAAPTGGRRWVAEELAVVAESKEVAGDVINEAVLDQVFGEKSFEKFGKWFISLHFSDQHPGSYKKILSLKFVLPDAKNMTEITRLVALVPYYIDLVGRYKVSSHVRSKTEAARAKAAQEAYKELQSARQEALQKKKAEKKKLMEETEAKLGAEALRKKEEKERARQMKKSMPKVKKLRS